MRHFFAHHSPIILAIMALAPYGVIYVAAALVLRVDEARALFGRAFGAAKLP